MPQRKQQTEAEAHELLGLIVTKRQQECGRLQAYADNTQYDDRPSYFDRDSPKPRLERRPPIIYSVVSSAIQANASMALGGERFPRVLSQVSEDDSAFDKEFGLSKEDSAVLDQFNAKLIDLCGFRANFLTAFKKAQAARSVALIVCYRNGYPAIDVVDAKTCTATFDPTNPQRVIALEIRYRYIDWQIDKALDPSGKPVPVVKEYRRVIDESSDTVFPEKEVWEREDVDPVASGGKSIPHGFGFCPVVWYARQRESYAVGGPDGKAIHEGKYTELDAINHSVSSRHLGALYAGDPILFGSGISPDETLGSVTRTARAQKIDTSEPDKGWDKALYGADGSPAIRKSPGELWRAESPDAKLGYLTLPGDALKAVSEHVADLCSKLREGLRYVWIDPEKLTGAGDISGKTLAFVFQSQVLAVTEDRDDFGRHCLLPALGLVYRMLVKNAKGVYLPGLKKTVPILQRFLVQVDGVGETFLAPQLSLKWGEIFPASDIDMATVVQLVIQALSAQLITLDVALEKIREIFDIEDLDAHKEALEKELEEKRQQKLKDMSDTIKVQTDAGGGPPQNDAAGGSGKPPPGSAVPKASPNAQSGNRGLKNAKGQKKAA